MYIYDTTKGWVANGTIGGTFVDVVDNLTTADADKALSANMGKKLNDEKLAITNIVNNLTTNDSKKALSAAQGKALNESKIDDAPKDGSPYMRKNGAWSAYTQIEEVYTFAPTISGNKITQEDYNGLKAAIEAGKIIAYGQQGMNGNYVATLSASMEDAIRFMTFAGDSFQVFTVTPDLTFTAENEYLILKNNTAEYEVIGDYNPAHKKYVDEAVVANSYKVLPIEVIEITQGMASDDIFAKFGGKSAYLDFVKNTPTNSIIRVEGGGLCVASMISYTNDNTSTLDIQTLALNASQYIRVTVSDGTASALTVKYIFVNESDVLKKNNTSAYTPTNDYHPSTKKYVDDKTKIYKYNDYSAINSLSTPIELKGDTAVIPYINSIFGSESNCKDIISKLAKGEISSLKFIYEFKDPDSGFYSYRSISSESFYIYIEESNGEWEIQFVYAGKLVIIDIVESILNNYKFIVKNLVSSDNITTLTKKTSTEYSNINPKANNTAYLVTDN